MQETESSRVYQLLQELTHERVYIRRSAVGTLVNMVVSNDDVSPELQSAVVTALLARLHDADYRVCTAAMRALRAIGVESDDAAEVQERIETLLGALEAEFPNVRRFASDALAEVIQHEAGASHEAPAVVVTALLGCLQDEDHGVRSGAIRALRTLGTEAQNIAEARTRVQLLLETLTSPHAYVRRFGVGALTEVVLSSDEIQRELQGGVTTALHAHQDDPDRGVRASVANALKILS